MSRYPLWRHYPHDVPAGPWANEAVEVFERMESAISTERGTPQLRRDDLLARLRPDLERLGYKVERGRAHSDRVEMPARFSNNGAVTQSIDVDAYCARTRTVIAVEAGRGAQNNEDVKNLVNAAVLHQVDHLVLAMPQYYRFGSPERMQTKRAFESTRELFDLVFGATSVSLGLKGVLLLGY